MGRMRFVFQKRGFSCFVRHVELPQLFGRIARRAGLRVGLTAGMSPHPHIVMGAALPVGVISTYELAEIWFVDDIAPALAVEKMNEQSPTGFKWLFAARISPDTMSLGKCYDAASYWMTLRDQSKNAEAAKAIQEDFSNGTLLAMNQVSDGLEFSTRDPSQIGPNAFVKSLTVREIISGWPDVCIARTCLGRWKADLSTVAPLIPLHWVNASV